MRHLCIVLSLIWVLLLPFHSAWGEDENPTIKVAAQLMPDLQVPGGNFPYNQLMNLLFDGSPVTANVTIFPGLRGVNSWVRKESQCMFGNITLPDQGYIPHSVMTEEEFAQIRHAGPFNTIRVHAFGASNAPSTDPIGIGNALVGIDLVTFADVNLYAPAFRRLRFVKVGSTVEAFNLLRQGRVSMVVAYDVDTALAHKDVPANQRPYFDVSQPILEFEEYLACWPGDSADQLLGHVRAKIKQLKADGTLKRLLPNLSSLSR